MILRPTRQDSFAVTLWRAHIERALRAAKTLRAGLPVPRLAARDPYALRGLVLVAVIATFFIAGSDRMRRINAAFNWQGVIAPANFRIDAWVSPPNYTGRPPVVLAAMRPGEPVPQSAGTVTVPTGSTLIIRASGQVSLDVAMTGGIEDAKAGGREGRGEVRRQDGRHAAGRRQSVDKGGADERRLVITEAGTVTLRSAVANDIVWRFTAIPDRAADDLARPRIRRGRRAALCSSPTSLRTTTASSARRPLQAEGRLKGTKASRRATCSTRRMSVWRCRRRAPRTASDRPPRI